MRSTQLACSNLSSCKSQKLESKLGVAADAVWPSRHLGDFIWTPRAPLPNACQLRVGNARGGEGVPNTGILVVNEAGQVTLANPVIERLFGFRRDELIGHPVEMLVAKEFAGGHEHLRRSFSIHPETRQMAEGLDAHGLRKDGRLFPIEVSLNPVEDEGRKGVLATVVDVSEYRKAEALQRLLFREFGAPREKSVCSVQGVVHRTIGRGPDRDALDGRLRALVRAHYLTSGSGWTGALLREIVQGELTGFSERFSTQGCDVRLTTSAAQQFALIIHELATNALKYGALSSPNGRVLH